jgi:hypothetical protein
MNLRKTWAEIALRAPSIPTSVVGSRLGIPAEKLRPYPGIEPQSRSRHYARVFRYAWVGLNDLLLISLLFGLFAIGWELSTRRYLQGFAGAIIPAGASDEEKIQAILGWMRRAPRRLPNGPSGQFPDRDPTETLNYASLLQVCGTATNAFVNLAIEAHLEVRRLLLLDPNGRTKHVVAEVRLTGRWIVVDPAYRVIFRDPEGRPETREDLSNPATFLAAIKTIPEFPIAYAFENTTHIHMVRLPVLGTPLQNLLDRYAPGWQDSVTMTLLVERESFAVLIASVFVIALVLLLRQGMESWGESRLGIRPIRLRLRIDRASVSENQEH